VTVQHMAVRSAANSPAFFIFKIPYSIHPLSFRRGGGGVRWTPSIRGTG